MLTPPADLADDVRLDAIIRDHDLTDDDDRIYRAVGEAWGGPVPYARDEVAHIVGLHRLARTAAAGARALGRPDAVRAMYAVLVVHHRRPTPGVNVARLAIAVADLDPAAGSKRAFAELRRSFSGRPPVDRRTLDEVRRLVAALYEVAPNVIEAAHA